MRGERKAWKFHTITNPTLTVQDQVEFTDADGESVTARIINGSRNLDGQSRLWTAILEQVSTET